MSVNALIFTELMNDLLGSSRTMGAYKIAHEIKVIVFNQNDFLWAEEHAAKANEACKLYLQPEWSKSKEMLPKIIEYVQQHPKWNISLQTHKYMGIP